MQHKNFSMLQCKKKLAIVSRHCPATDDSIGGSALQPFAHY
jgi:hypothetical protein